MTAPDGIMQGEEGKPPQRGDAGRIQVRLCEPGRDVSRGRNTPVGSNMIASRQRLQASRSPHRWKSVTVLHHDPESPVLGVDETARSSINRSAIARDWGVNRRAMSIPESGSHRRLPDLRRTPDRPQTVEASAEHCRRRERGDVWFSNSPRDEARTHG